MEIKRDENRIILQNNKRISIITLFFYCVSGTSLTLTNKLAITVFPYTNLLLVLQNGVTLTLLLLCFRFAPLIIGSVPTLNIAIMKVWIPLVALFVIMLTSSLTALAYVSIATVIVMRNLSTLFVALLEYIILSYKISILSIATLFGMVLGALVYAKHDLTFNITGYTWLCINVVSTSGYQIYIKQIINNSLIDDIRPISMCYYNNLISIPILLILAYLLGETTILSLPLEYTFVPSIKSTLVIALSCILGFVVSITAFILNKTISATSMMVANNVNKFILIVLGEIFVKTTLQKTSTLGALFVLVLGWLYSRALDRFSIPLIISVGVIFIALYATIPYNVDFLLMINYSHWK